VNSILFYGIVRDAPGSVSLSGWTGAFATRLALQAGKADEEWRKNAWAGQPPQ
jgi:hypothetical protein